MAVTPEIDLSQGKSLSVVSGTTTEIRLPQGKTLAAYGFPTEEMRISEGKGLITVNASKEMQVSQGTVLAVAAGRVKNFTLRAWTFTQDGHDFYVLHLGEDGTLVYDCLTQQWMTWESEHRDVLLWKAATGTPWNSVQNYAGNSDAICIDDTTGMMYWINSAQAWDDTNGIDPSLTQEDFQRVLTGGIPARGRGNTSCNYVFLTGSLGNPYSGSQVLLQTSDDLGKTWTENGYITIDPDNWTQDVTWSSLGSFGTPGRIFEVIDNGAFERIDSLDMT